ncbi:IclR family transcriptional regulator [Devosia nitrariae]|uniref:IclR-ED domain-containing protein n=1 Tax=Devosia nitrariae TaxID=2071872 RepID=A0ABQ5W792_9HYPH|nr:IclR family transcriptional regulator [Devosia nitrariae]GLQ55918.1 hypothetical protein GCM10010862_31770 [Devosia nitrariae]
MTTLEAREFVHFSPGDNHWHVGLGAFAVGTAFERDRHFVSTALPSLRRLRDVTKGREICRSVARVGGRVPITTSGMGKAILSSYSLAEISDVLRRRGLRRLTPNTLATREALVQNLIQIESVGYSVDDQENSPDVRCIAAPVYDGRSEILCAISVSGVPSRITPDCVPVIGRTVARIAGELSDLMRGQGAPLQL